jgi:hypothetical protein
MFECFYPDEIKSSAYVIDYEGLYKAGYRGLLFDIDNTLVPHGKAATSQAKELFARLKKIGFSCGLISNNDRERVEMFNKEIGVHTVVKANKPSTKGFEQALRLMGTDKKNTVFIGDQLFTDVWGAKRTGLRNILVKPIDKHEEIQIVLKRRLEWIVLREYKKKRKEKRNRNE